MTLSQKHKQKLSTTILYF